MSAYEHKIYYGTSENMKTSAFITFLNGGEGEFLLLMDTILTMVILFYLGKNLRCHPIKSP